MLPIGGGRLFPTDEAARKRWIDERTVKSDLTPSRIEALLGRYGTTADAVIAHIALAGEAMLPHVDGYSDAEIDWIARTEMIEHLADIVMRRTVLAITGRLSAAALEEISVVAARALNWDETRRAEEVEAVKVQLQTFNRVPL
jgi:glycerol-3-phosphate dehydrogenase